MAEIRAVNVTAAQFGTTSRRKRRLKRKREQQLGAVRTPLNAARETFVASLHLLGGVVRSEGRGSPHTIMDYTEEPR